MGRIGAGTLAWALVGSLAPLQPAPLQAAPDPSVAQVDPDPCPPLQAQAAIAPLPANGSLNAQPPPASGPGAGRLDYRHRLQPTPLGWARRDHWCVWIEPGADGGPAALWEGRWRQAVDGALRRWQALLPITLVDGPQRAQVQLLRRRPPLRQWRASHGRAELALRAVRRGAAGQPPGPWQAEPLVLVQISPGQALAAMQATALHELGHAFGLWGHSDQPGDALATSPGSTPVLELSPRDRATLLWLQAQPALAGWRPPRDGGERPDARPAPPAPAAN